MAFLTMYFSALAHINVGIIATMWSITPLFMAIIDCCIFKEKLEYCHFIGMVSIIACTIVLSLGGVIKQNLPIIPGSPNPEI